MATYVRPGQLGIAAPTYELVGASDAQMHAELQDYKNLGANWVRVDFSWNEIQTTANGSYNWANFDKVVNAINSYGLEVIAVLGKTPSWAGTTLSTTAGQTAFGNFARAAAEHFGDRVDNWEIINEPNKEGITAVNYTKALKAAHTGINAIDGDDMVISGGLSPVPSDTNGFYGAAKYLDTIYDQGGKNYFDAVGFNPYSWPLMPGNSAAWNGWQIMEDGIRGAMVENGDSGKQVWVMEYGSPTGGGGSSVTQANQAAQLQEAVTLASQTSWIGPIMYYSYQDRATSGSTEDFFGMLTASGARKPVYYTYQSFATKDDDTSGATAATTHTYTSATTTARITSFSDGDKIDLSAIDANSTVSGKQTFAFIGSNWLSKAADLGVYKNTSQNYTEVQAYMNADSKYDLSIRITGIHNLDASDFVLGSSGETFRFTSLPAYSSITTYDAGDKIDLSAIDANTKVSGNQAFSFVGSEWLDAAGELAAYRNASRNTTDIQGDLNGDGVVDFTIVVNGLHTLAAGDFIL